MTRVSAATREFLSCARMASRIPSEIWSATLSGWPSETDSEVKRKSLDTLVPFDVGLLRCPLERSGDALAEFPSAMLSRIRPASCRLTRRKSPLYGIGPVRRMRPPLNRLRVSPSADGRQRAMLNLLLRLVAALPLRAVHAIGGAPRARGVLAVADIPAPTRREPGDSPATPTRPRAARRSRAQAARDSKRPWIWKRPRGDLIARTSVDGHAPRRRGAGATAGR